QRPDCCGPVGGDGPVLYELYARIGPAIVTGGGVFNRTLDTGWMVAAGGRSLFFNPAQTAAWTIDLGISNSHNDARKHDVQIPLSILVPTQFGTAERVNFGRDPDVPGVTVRELNRTFANIGFGREVYPVGPANGPGTKWRIGYDLGGRWGTAKLEL